MADRELTLMPAFDPVRSFDCAGASVKVFHDAERACGHAADLIAGTIKRGVGERGKAVLGLATGGTPIAIYARLVALHHAGELSFAGVRTFNLDEYYPISPVDPQSYRSYMHRHLFGHVDLEANRAHVLDGTVPEGFVGDHVANFDRWMEAEGGLDLQLLGIGRNGHIGFNEPSEVPLEEALRLRTRLVDLHPMTVEDAVADFGSESEVIRRALTVGVAPILAARSILILALGGHKAEAVRGALMGPLTSRLPASLLQAAGSRVTWLLDAGASAGIV